ncbi:MAG: sigma-54-dependent Fis family transcriptional regulator [Syntrophomonadaceae bacterium]|nr:sigma-54-dependent Fis family transcriptional regulator [Syntrophomonadaceae bacterium]
MNGKGPNREVWLNYSQKGYFEPEQVRLIVADSWKRSESYGISPINEKDVQIKSARQMKSIMAETEGLRELARPFMERLLKIVEGSGFIVTLTDSQCCIVAIYGDRETLDKAKHWDYKIGTFWSENEMGTNAIGVAAFLQEPVQISGAEHYWARRHSLTCSAAPIMENDQLIGILNISGPSCNTHSHTLGMVVAAAQAIEMELEKEKFYRQESALHNQLNGVFDAMSEGVIVLDNAGIVQQTNPAARRQLGFDGADLIGIKASELLQDKGETVEKLLTKGEECEFELFLDRKSGAIHSTGVGKPIIDGERNIVGATIILRRIDDVRHMVNRITGARATFTFDSIIGQDKELDNAIKLAKIASRNTSGVLLQGESGTGKEVFAQAIHNGSERRDGPFIAVNCAALPRELVGSELFGYDEGAFTGAKKGGRSGKFELANGGTLLLDEIGDMPLEQQGSLLRAIQEKAVVRVGGERLIRVDVRIIAATNQDLLGLVERGQFRQDLYYRLNVMQLTIPPLRERREDILLLFHHFLNIMSKKLGKTMTRVDEEVITIVSAYDWPGNVRELQNVVERIILVVEDGHITRAHLPAELMAGNPQNLRGEGWEWGSRSVVTVAHDNVTRESRQQAKREREKHNIICALDTCSGNVSQAALALGISRNTLYRKLKKYDIQN